MVRKPGEIRETSKEVSEGRPREEEENEDQSCMSKETVSEARESSAVPNAPDTHIPTLWPET